MKNHTIVSLVVLTSLCFGVCIYATTRTDDLILNQWLAPFGGHTLRLLFQEIFTAVTVPDGLIDSLPDALWMLALMLVILMVWNYKINAKSLPWLLLAFTSGIFFEFGQQFHLVRGTFDPGDLIGICIGASIPISILLIKSPLCKLK